MDLQKKPFIANLENSVQLLFNNNRYCEALLLASTNPDLFIKAKEIYFSKEKDLFIKNIFPVIITKNFDLLLNYNISKEWKEYLFYPYSYTNKDNFSNFKNFADKLGDKIYSIYDMYSSLICFILAEKYDQAIDMLYNIYLKEKDKTENKKELLINIFEKAQILDKILNVKNSQYNI